MQIQLTGTKRGTVTKTSPSSWAKKNSRRTKSRPDRGTLRGRHYKFVFAFVWGALFFGFLRLAAAAGASATASSHLDWLGKRHFRRAPDGLGEGKDSSLSSPRDGRLFVCLFSSMLLPLSLLFWGSPRTTLDTQTHKKAASDTLHSDNVVLLWPSSWASVVVSGRPIDSNQRAPDRSTFGGWLWRHNRCLSIGGRLGCQRRV